MTIPRLFRDRCRELGSRPCARGLARRDARRRRPPFRPQLHEPNRQLSVTPATQRGLPSALLAGACFRTERDRKRIGGRGEGACTYR